jgi:hypothetical protein
MIQTVILDPARNLASSRIRIHNDGRKVVFSDGDADIGMLYNIHIVTNKISDAAGEQGDQGREGGGRDGAGQLSRKWRQKGGEDIFTSYLHHPQTLYINIP